MKVRALILMARNKRMLNTTLLMRENSLRLASPMLKCGRSNAWNAGIIRTIFAEEEPGEMLDMHRNFSIPSLSGLCVFSLLFYFAVV